MEISHNYYHSNGDYNDKYLNHEDDVVLPELSPDRPSCQDLAIEGERLSKQGDYAEAIPVLEAAIETGTCDMQLLSVLWSLLGNAHFYQGDYETAIKCHSHDLAICCETNDEKSKAQAYCNLGISQRKSGFLKKAKLCYESYLELCEQLEDRRSISKANHNLGDLHLTLGKLKIQRDGGMENSPEGRDDLASASMYIEKHLEFVQDHGSRASECRAHGTLGVIYEMLKNTDKAIEHHQKRLDIALELNDKGHMGRAYCSIGNCLRAILQPDKAMECYKRGLSIASELDDQTGLGVCHCNIATTFEMLGKIEEAADQNEKYFAAMKNTGNLDGQLTALNCLAKMYESLANVSRRIDALQKLVFVHRELNDEEKVKETLSEIAQLGNIETINENAPTTPVNGVSTNSTSSSPKGENTKKGILKKLKEKRAKKRSVIGPETSMSVSGLIKTASNDEIAWRSSSPVAGTTTKEDKKKKSSSKEKLNIITIHEHQESRSQSVSSREEMSIAESPQTKKRSMSHGNINKEPDEHIANKLSHSSSVTFESNVINTIEECPSALTPSYNNTPEPPKKILYDTFGTNYHKGTLQELDEFLETAEEKEPADLSKLQDLDGWMIGSRDVIIQSTKESKLI